MSSFYINPAYKSSIFSQVETSPMPNRAAKENMSKSQERAAPCKQNYDSNSFAQDTYFRQKRWDYKDRSIDESRYGSSMDQSLVKASQDRGMRSFNEENKNKRAFEKEADQNRSRSNVRLQENTNKQPLKESDFNKHELEIAIQQKNKSCRDQFNYKKELDKQVKEKHKNKKIDELVDLSYSKSGLPIGEIHGGLDVEQQAKLMRIKADNKARRDSQEGKPDSFRERSMSITKEEESQIQNYGSHSYRGSSLSFYNERKVLAKSFIERVEEEAADLNTQASPKTARQKAAGLPSNVQSQNKKRKAENPSESILNPLGSKYTLKKACHEKLREALKSQYKKYEDYTAKLLEDSKKRKQVLMDDLENHMTKDQHKRKAVVFRDKEQEKKHKEMQIGENKHLESLLQMKEAQLTKISERGMSREKAIKQKSARTKQEREGMYMRVVNDTINQLLNKRTKLVEQVQRRSSTANAERKTFGK